MNAGAMAVAGYIIGLLAFALVGLLEWAMSAIEIRRIDRDDWARGEPWQRAHNHREREREQASGGRALTLTMYAPVWPLLILIVLYRIARRRKEPDATHE